MSKKHFIAIAKILAGDYASASNKREREKVWGITCSLADYFKSVNPRFDRERFYFAVTGN